MAFMGKKVEADDVSMPVKPMATETKPHGMWCSTCWGMQDFGKKILFTLVGVLIVYLIFFVGTMMRNNIRTYDFIGQMDQTERMVTVTGVGKATGKNDIAMTSIGYTNTDMDVKKAQEDNNKIMNKVLADLKAMGVDEKDLQTSYTISPTYNYTLDKGQTLKGYEVNQLVTVKIRDLTKISNVLALASKDGANNVGSLSFTVDDQEHLKAEARDKALKDVRLQAARLANSLGVVLGEVISYNEYETPDYSYGSSYGYGGSMAADVAPTVASGSKDESMTVNVTYKVLGTRY